MVIEAINLENLKRRTTGFFGGSLNGDKDWIINEVKEKIAAEAGVLDLATLIATSGDFGISNWK